MEAKARQQHLKRELGVDVTELRAIEIKAQRSLRQILDICEPHKPGLSVDKAANEPSGAHPINPHTLARRPGLALKVFNVASRDLAMHRLRFVRREFRIQRTLRIVELFLQLF